MVKNPLIRPKVKSYATPMPNQSAGILDDYAVRVNVATKEGTIEHVPTDANHLVNKAYVDSQDDNYLLLDGSNANVEVNIGTQGLACDYINLDNAGSGDISTLDGGYFSTNGDIALTNGQINVVNGNIIQGGNDTNVPTTGNFHTTKDAGNGLFAASTYSDTSTHSGAMFGYRARGTEASPEGVEDGDFVFRFFGRANDGGGASGSANWQISSEIRMFIDGEVSDNVVPMGMSIITGETTTANRTEAITFRADQTTEIKGDMLFIGSGTGLPFGEIYASDNAIATTITTQNVWVQVTIFDTDGESNNTTPVHGSDHITITKAGVYRIHCSGSVFSGAGATFNAEFEVKKNNGATDLPNVHTDRNLSGGGGDHGAIAMDGLVALEVDDTIELWCRNKTNTVNMTFEDITLNVVQIGG